MLPFSGDDCGLLKCCQDGTLLGTDPESAMDRTKFLIKQLCWGAGLLLLTVIFLFGLDQAKLHSLFEERVAAENNLIAGYLASAIENQASIGLTPELSAGTQGILDRTMALHDDIQGIAISDGDAVFVSTGVVQSKLLTRSIQYKKSSYKKSVRDGELGVASRKLDLQMGVDTWVSVVYTLDDAREQSYVVFKKSLPTLIMSLILAMSILLIVLPYIVRNGRDHPDVLARQVAYVLGGLLLAVHFNVGFATYKTYQAIGNEYAEKIANISGLEIKSSFERSMKIGIPLHQTVGVDRWLSNEFSDATRGIRSIRVFGVGGVFVGDYVNEGVRGIGPFSYPLKNGSDVVGVIAMEVNEDHVSNHSSLLYIEFMMLFIVGLILIYECFVAFMKRNDMTRNPVADLRLSVFFFVFGVELGRPAMPLIAMQFQESAPDEQSMALQLLAAVVEWTGLRPEMLMAVMPMWVSIALVAISSPFWGYIGSRLGTKLVFYAAGCFGVASMFQGLMVDDALDLIQVRVLSGIAFAAISVAALAALAEDGKWSGEGISQYFTTYVSAAMCGLGVGSLVTERISYSATFGIGLFCMIIAMMFVKWIPNEKLLIASTDVKPPIRVAFMSLFKNTNLMMLFFMIVVPLNVVQQGVMYVWLPIELTQNGESLVVVGIGFMAYMASAYSTSLIVSMRGGLENRSAIYVILGQLIAAIGMVAGYFNSDLLGTVLMSSLLGCSWSLTFSSLSAIGLNSGRDILHEGLGFAYIAGVYRGAERLALLFSPVVLLILLSLSQNRSILIYSLVLLIGSMVCFVVFRKYVGSSVRSCHNA